MDRRIGDCEIKQHVTVLLFVLQNNLLNMVCCSLVNKSCTPGQKDWDKKTSVWAIIKVLATEITTEDPEFLLKVGVFVCVSVCGLCCRVLTWFAYLHWF